MSFLQESACWLDESWLPLPLLFRYFPRYVMQHNANNLKAGNSPPNHYPTSQRTFMTAKDAKNNPRTLPVMSTLLQSMGENRLNHSEFEDNQRTWTLCSIWNLRFPRSLGRFSWDNTSRRLIRLCPSWRSSNKSFTCLPAWKKRRISVRFFFRSNLPVLLAWDQWHRNRKRLLGPGQWYECVNRPGNPSGTTQWRVILSLPPPPHPSYSQGSNYQLFYHCLSMVEQVLR